MLRAILSFGFGELLLLLKIFYLKRLLSLCHLKLIDLMPLLTILILQRIYKTLHLVELLLSFLRWLLVLLELMDLKLILLNFLIQESLYLLILHGMLLPLIHQQIFLILSRQPLSLKLLILLCQLCL